MVTAGIVSERSRATVETHHLHRLARIAINELESLFHRRAETGDLYRNRRILICLCQGGARHFVHRDCGIKDFDVWAFFRKSSQRPFPYRWHGKRDFGHSRFGRHPDAQGFQGRWVDVFGRSITCGNEQRPGHCIRQWLRRTAPSPREVAKSPVVVIHPEADIGKVIWNPRPGGKGVPEPHLRAGPCWPRTDGERVAGGTERRVQRRQRAGGGSGGPVPAAMALPPRLVTDELVERLQVCPRMPHCPRRVISATGVPIFRLGLTSISTRRSDGCSLSCATGQS